MPAGRGWGEEGGRGANFGEDGRDGGGETASGTFGRAEALDIVLHEEAVKAEGGDFDAERLGREEFVQQTLTMIAFSFKNKKNKK